MAPKYIDVGIFSGFVMLCIELNGSTSFGSSFSQLFNFCGILSLWSSCTFQRGLQNHLGQRRVGVCRYGVAQKSGGSRNKGNHLRKIIGYDNFKRAHLGYHVDLSNDHS